LEPEEGEGIFGQGCKKEEEDMEQEQHGPLGGDQIGAELPPSEDEEGTEWGGVEHEEHY
jgi:hypothetical protein